MKSFLLFFLMSLFVCDTLAQIKFESTSSLTPALKLAKEKRKFIFIDVYADWCGPCKWMDLNVFNKKQVGDFFNDRFINIKANYDQNGRSIASDYNVTMFPTYLFLDSMGNLKHTTIGSMDDYELLDHARIALQDENKTLDKYRSKYDAGARSSSFLVSYFMYLKSINHPDRFDVAEERMENENNWLSEENMRFIFLNCNISKTPKFYSFIAKNRSYFNKYFKESAVDSIIRLGIVLKLAKVPESKMPEQLGKELSKLVPEKKQQWMEEYYLSALWRKVTNDTQLMDSFCNLMQAYYKKYSKSSASFIRDMALNVCLNCDKASNLIEALRWASRAIQENKGDWLCNYTLAYLFYRLGNMVSAKSFIDTAYKCVSNATINQLESVDRVNKLKALIDSN